MAQTRTTTAFEKFLKKVLTYVFDGGTMYLSVRDRQPTDKLQTTISYKEKTL